MAMLCGTNLAVATCTVTGRDLGAELGPSNAGEELAAPQVCGEHPEHRSLNYSPPWAGSCDTAMQKEGSSAPCSNDINT